MSAPPFISQSGPARESRIVAVKMQGSPFSFTIEAGERLLEGAARG
ncbi:MAG: hypothetical protein HEQ16_16920 [Bosea sp.]|jgi:hypothetical protein|nr:hypothetical protein [Bosea sp. (in: a-proteobacteria)]